MVADQKDFQISSLNKLLCTIREEKQNYMQELHIVSCLTY
jgi:hypothetical protein